MTSRVSADLRQTRSPSGTGKLTIGRTQSCSITSFSPDQRHIVHDEQDFIEELKFDALRGTAVHCYGLHHLLHGWRTMRNLDPWRNDAYRRGQDPDTD